MCIPGEPEIWHQHPVLEDRWGPNEGQRGETCFAEKYSNRRSVTNPHLFSQLFAVINDKSILVKYLFSLCYSLICHVLPPGVAYTSECFPCKPGTFSRVPGSTACDPCSRDTYAGHGASSCTPCNTTTQYAGRNTL